MSSIEIKKENIYSIFDKQLLIAEYQREYIWNEDNIEKLISDIKTYYSKEENNNNEYFLGSLLLYKKISRNNTKAEYEIIDGQQRVITFYLILKHIEKMYNQNNLKENNLKIYNSILENSKNNIILNNIYIKNRLNNNNEESDILYEHLKKIVFTVIITDNIDNAFTFFDTHNTSGIRLNTADLLKAYHLRALKDIDCESTVENIVYRWDSNNAKNGMKKILEDTNFSIRTTKGKNLLYSSKNNFYEYQKMILNNYKNPDMQNDLAYKELFINKIIFQDYNNYSIENNNNYYGNNILNLPFSIRQPIKDGISFFLYSDKYRRLYEFLFVEEKDIQTNFELFYIKKLYDNVIKKLQYYLVLVFEHLTFYYYDKFENTNLLRFVINLLNIIGYYRLKNYSIREAVYKNIILENKVINLFDLINISYNTDEVINTLSNIISSFNINDKLKIKELNPVRKYFFDNFKCFIEELKNKMDSKAISEYSNLILEKMIEE